MLVYLLSTNLLCIATAKPIKDQFGHVCHHTLGRFQKNFIK